MTTPLNALGKFCLNLFKIIPNGTRLIDKENVNKIKSRKGWEAISPPPVDGGDWDCNLRLCIMKVHRKGRGRQLHFGLLLSGKQGWYWYPTKILTTNSSSCSYRILVNEFIYSHWPPPPLTYKQNIILNIAIKWYYIGGRGHWTVKFYWYPKVSVAQYRNMGFYLMLKCLLWQSNK